MENKIFNAKYLQYIYNSVWNAYLTYDRHIKRTVLCLCYFDGKSWALTRGKIGSLALSFDARKNQEL